MQDYKSPYVVVTICAILVNTRAETSLLTGYVSLAGSANNIK